MIKLGETEADPLSDARFTSTPFAGAGFARVTVPVEDWPPFTAGGFSIMPEICPIPALFAVILSGAVALFAEVAVIWTR